MRLTRGDLIIIFLAVCAYVSAAFEGTVKNFRPVVTSATTYYRCGTLDNLSMSDAQDILEGAAFSTGRRLAAVIDLRNLDEIRKGAALRSDGANYFYSCMDNNDYRLCHVPILGDVNAFWEEAIDRMNPIDRTKATLQNLFVDGALDRAAARNMEQGGLQSLNTIMVDIAIESIGECLNICLEEAEKGTVLFHCQKGKDRTGIISMLIQSCLGLSDEEILESYAISASLLDEKEITRGDGDSEDSSGSGGSLVDWKYFRGSPSAAMAGTIEYIRKKYGSTEGYLDRASFGSEKRKLLKERIFIPNTGDF